MTRSLLIAALMLAAIAPAPAAAAPDLAPALERVKAKDWPGAQRLLERQVGSGCPAQALNLLGLARAKRDDARGALEAETRALSCDPALEPAYRAGAANLVRWASARLAVASFSFGGTMAVAPSFLDGLKARIARKVAERDLEDLIRDGDGAVPGLSRDFAAARADSPCGRLRGTAATAADAQACQTLITQPPAPPPEVPLPQ